MPKREDIKSILVIGSGPIVIGQACEFDYSGTQALKALKEEGYRIILVNSNPATIMTDPQFADETYIEPIELNYLREVIKKERPDAILPTIGGQTALNAAIELEEKGVLEEFGVELIGATVEAIKKAEDRALFRAAVDKCGLESARSHLVTNMDEAYAALEDIGLPIIIRPSRTLGGSGGGIIEKREDFENKVKWGFEQSPVGEILLEESLLGWKEMEVEAMRDSNDNGVIVCGIENVDPMGVHTGDSITVAPIQTLSDKEYQKLRTSTLKLMNEIGVSTGGSNVQFAICPNTGRQIVIEMNPRVSRSSALASKATGFPIAKLAAKLAVGYTLDELSNDITKKTPACFEPSIDYVVVKIPRFAFEKFSSSDDTLGTQMKSVGEAMAIGRTFPEAFNKAFRSLELDFNGVLIEEHKELNREQVIERLSKLKPFRLSLAARALELGIASQDIYDESGIDTWFLHEIKKIIDVEKELRESELSLELVTKAKRLGVSDSRIAELKEIPEDNVRKFRHDNNLRPAYKMIDTCAGEFESNTPYYYSSYDDTSDDVYLKDKKKIVILGGGPNRIGQGLEFDYCCVHASYALNDAGYSTVMINCNPETVSTDYDTSDILYFEPLTKEDVLEVIHREKPLGTIVQYGGQTPLKIADALQGEGVNIIGTSPAAIEATENREEFKEIVQNSGLKQAQSGLARTKEEAIEVATEIGFPMVVRPSYVLGGRAMAIISNMDQLQSYINESVSVSNERPVLLDRFLDDAIEIDVDAVCDGQRVCIAGIMEHIERAGIHSGDSSFILPSLSFSAKNIKDIEEATKKLASECKVKGLMNIQFALKGDDLYILEVNPRASRSVPFVAKVFGIQWAKVGARVMAGESLEELSKEDAFKDILRFENYSEAISKVDYIAVKEAVFPFVKFRGTDTALGPEMKSTGEVLGIANDLGSAFNRAQIGSNSKLPSSGTVFISFKDEDKNGSEKIAKKLTELGFGVVATSGTASYLQSQGIDAKSINKVREGSPHIVDALEEGKISLVFNSPEGTGPLMDSTSIRCTAVENSIPLYTTKAAAEATVEALVKICENKGIEVNSIQEYIKRRKSY